MAGTNDSAANVDVDGILRSGGFPIGVDSVDREVQQVVCWKSDNLGVTTPHLSPSLLQLSGGDDLFKMWYDITLNINSLVDGDDSSSVEKIRSNLHREEL